MNTLNVSYLGRPLIVMTYPLVLTVFSQKQLTCKVDIEVACFLLDNYDLNLLKQTYIYYFLQTEVCVVCKYRVVERCPVV